MASVPSNWCYNEKPEQTWEEIGTVTELYVYPLKGGYRVQSNSIFVNWYGSKTTSENGNILRDKCLVVYDEQTHIPQTSRMFPKILQIKASYNPETRVVELSAPDVKDLVLSVDKITKDNAKTAMIDYDLPGIESIDCGDEASKWLSSLIIEKSYGLRLAFNNINKFKKSTRKNSNHTGVDLRVETYNDNYGVWLINGKSLNDLNNNCNDFEEKCVVDCLRPNIVIDGEDLPPYIEERFTSFKIGNVLFQGTPPSGFGMYTITDPEHISCNNSVEKPIRRLQLYHRVNKLFSREIHDPVMGVILKVVKKGMVNVGDKVYVLI